MAELTGEDFARLAGLRGARPVRRHGGAGVTVQDLAMRLGAPGIAGIAPVLPRRMPCPARRAGEAEGGVFLSPSPAQEAALTDAAKRGPDAQVPPEGFRFVLAAARREAAQSRDRRARERVATYLPPRGEEALRQVFAPVRRNLPASPPDLLRGQQAMGWPEFALPAVRLAQTMPGWRGRGPISQAFATEVGRGVEPGAGSSEKLNPPVARPAGRAEGEDLAQALRAYFFRQSRLPPAGGTGFDPRLTPAWAGVKIPG
ncbi:MAG: hypothetical protein ACLPJJ_10220 [Acidocella sp.]|uniref:hypothetical protein n=1 Tax=Acidocella sp. TaxID=50710 RepID=UPI003FC076E9